MKSSDHPTRQRIVHAAAALMARFGYTGAGVKQIAAESGAPLGSVYHFFPGGKEEIGAEALRYSGRGYQLLVEGVLDSAPDMRSGIEACFAGAAEVLELSDYTDACPIATIALEVASTNDGLRQVTHEIFEAWIASGVERGVGAGLSPEEAREFTMVFVAGLEGAFLLSRAAKSTEAMVTIGRAVVDELDRVLARAGLSSRA